ncbi:MAG: adenylosuccinate lyase [Gammaproteobacteria bacterium]|nr:adenylosuccinate lyase [Gammaproteobacteria bacterium]
MELNMLSAISPIDGRYGDVLKDLRRFFSECSLIKYRLLVEIRWLQFLANLSDIKELPKLDAKTNQFLDNWIQHFSINEAKKIKAIEKTTHHDVKAVEYFLKEVLQKNTQDRSRPVPTEFVHFACTSEDINNTAYALILNDFRKDILLKNISSLIALIQKLAKQFAQISMLSRTHGQPATPTTLGKEFANFVHRLNRQKEQIEAIHIMAKFNGAVGNYNAHVAAYPNIAWDKINQKFIERLGLNFSSHTTQIAPHDDIAELSHAMMRFNTILIDFCRDIWGYISLNYFDQKVDKKTVGSSTMPHKINPIHFENAEGNLGLSNALFQHFANKLPISRFQRDLSDSTVLRNVGVAFAHSILSYQSIEKGLNQLTPNLECISKDLNDHWEILAEPIQTVMRKHGIEQAYEKLKTFTRGKKITQQMLHQFIDQLDLPKPVKLELKNLTPKNYLGLAVQLSK